MMVPADGSAAAQPLSTSTPLMPLEIDGVRLGVRHDPPAIGADSRQLLAELGLSGQQIDDLRLQDIIEAPAT